MAVNVYTLYYMNIEHACNDSAGVQYDYYYYLVIFKIVNLEQNKCVNNSFSIWTLQSFDGFPISKKKE